MESSGLLKRLKIEFGGALLLLFVIIFGFVSYYGMTSLSNTSKWVNRTYEIIDASDDLWKLIIDLETGERGFLLTGKESFLEAYNKAKANLLNQLLLTTRQLEHEPEQLRRINRVEELVNQWIEKVGSPTVIERRKISAGAKGFEYLQDLVRGGSGKQVLQKIRGIIDGLELDFQRSNNLKAHKLLLAIAKDIADMETSERGFLITGKSDFLEPYLEAKDLFGAHIDELHGIVDSAYARNEMDNDIEEVKRYSADWNTKIAIPEIAMRRKMNKGAKQGVDIKKLLLRKEGAEILDRLTDKLDHMTAHVKKSNNQRAQILILGIAKAMVDQEKGLRGFLLTGKEEFLKPYIDGQSSLQKSISFFVTLSQRAYDVSSTRRLLVKIEDLTEEWINIAANPEIAVRKEINKNSTNLMSITQIIEKGGGKKIMDEIRSELIIFERVERVNMTVRQADAVRQSNLQKWIEIFSSLVVIGFSVIILRTASKFQAQSRTLETERSKLEEADWVKTNYSSIIDKLQGLTELQTFAETVIKELVHSLDAPLALFYVNQVNNRNEVTMSLLASYAYKRRKNVGSSFSLGEGLVGQCALEKKPILLSNIPDDYIRITSGAGEMPPKSVYVFPVLFEEAVLAVIEMASMEEFSEIQLALLEQFGDNVGVIINNISANIKTEELLKQSQAQAEDLKAQQEELQAANENLEEQTQLLKASEEELKSQGEELRVSNEELEEKQEILRKQKDELAETKNKVVQKARDLAQTSKYKTEFLANMSHELRTPLNSLLILSKSLGENKEGNLTQRQLEDVKVIYEGGNDLLNLINDIMDLSKVEAGMLTIQAEEVEIEGVLRNLTNLFTRVGSEKGVTFIVEMEETIPRRIKTDGQRLEQIIKNFLSNAFKFTSNGSVTLKIHNSETETNLQNSDLRNSPTLAFSVMDTGIGISEEKQQLIFETFQQEDGTITRKYGGTGLGLTISKQLATLLGGEITLQSEKGSGSIFTLYLPVEWHLRSNAVDTISPCVEDIEELQVSFDSFVAPGGQCVESFIVDDRRNIVEDDNTILIIEDDAKFATVLKDIAHKNSFKCLTTDKGRDGLLLAMEYLPRGILLDIGLPDVDGLLVLEQLKANIKTRHIPIHVVSGRGQKQLSLKQGALSFLSKPTNEKEVEAVLSNIKCHGEDVVKKVLVVEDDEKNQQAIERLIQSKGIQMFFAATGQEAVEMLRRENFDCLILDLGLPDISGFEVLKQIAQVPELKKMPVIIYTGQEITNEEQRILSKYADDIIIKGSESPERLLDDVSLFLHSVTEKLPEEQKNTICMLHDEDMMLRDRKVLLVDDDMRNTFALSRKLEDVGLEVTMAENGQVALDLLEGERPFEFILMDIMMPVMDGYETMKRIRKMPMYSDIPIIALTAKAMPEDCAKCLEAGASEYLTKPVDTDKLLSMVRVWLYRHATHE